MRQGTNFGDFVNIDSVRNGFAMDKEKIARELVKIAQGLGETEDWQKDRTVKNQLLLLKRALIQIEKTAKLSRKALMEGEKRGGRVENLIEMMYDLRDDTEVIGNMVVKATSNAQGLIGYAERMRKL